jgi:hypothetical protein
MADSISRTGFGPFQVVSNKEFHMKSFASSQKQIPDAFFDEVVQKSTHMADLWGLSASSSRDNLGVNMMDKACGDMVKYGSEYGLITHDQVFLEADPDNAQLFCLGSLGHSDIANVLRWSGEQTEGAKGGTNDFDDASVFRKPNAVFSISYKRENVLYKIFFCYVNDSTEQTQADKMFHGRNLWQQVDGMRQLNTEKIPVVTIRANFFNMKQVDGASDTDKISNFLMDMYVQHLWTLFMTLKMVRDRRGVFHTESKTLYDVHVFLGQYTMRCGTRLQKFNGSSKTYGAANLMQNSPFFANSEPHVEHCQYATHYGTVNVLKVERIDVEALIRTFSNKDSNTETLKKKTTGVCYLTDIVQLLKELRPTFIDCILNLSVDLLAGSTTQQYTMLGGGEKLNWDNIVLTSNYEALQDKSAFMTFIRKFSQLLDMRMRNIEDNIKFIENKVEPVSRLIQKINYELKNNKLLFSGRQNLNPPVYPTTPKKMSLKTRLCTADYGKVALDPGFKSDLDNFNIPFAQHFFRSIACTNKLACQELAQQMETNRKIEERVNKQLTSYPLTTQTEILYFLKQILKKNEIFTKPTNYKIGAINEFSAFFEAVFWCSDLTPGQLLYKKIRALERVLLLPYFDRLYDSGVYNNITPSWLLVCRQQQSLTKPAYFLWKCTYVSLAANLSSDDYTSLIASDINGRACIENAVVRQTQYENRFFTSDPSPHDLPLQIEFIHDACRDTCVLQALANLLAAIDRTGHMDDFNSGRDGYGTIRMICLIGFFQINFESAGQFVQIMTIEDFGSSGVNIQQALDFNNLKTWVGSKLRHAHLYAIKINRDIRNLYNPGGDSADKYESLFGNQGIIETLFVKYTEVTTNTFTSNSMFRTRLDTDVAQRLENFVKCCIVKIFSSADSFLSDYLNFADFGANTRATVSIDTVRTKITEYISSKTHLTEATQSYIVQFYTEAFSLLNVHIQSIENDSTKQTELKKGNVNVEEVQITNQGSAIFAAVKHLPLIEAWPAGDLISYSADDVSKIAEICKHLNRKRQMNTDVSVLYKSNSLLLKLQERIKNKTNLPLDNIDIVQFDPALIQRLDKLDSEMMFKHHEYMSSLTHTNFEVRFDELRDEAGEISKMISEKLQSAVRAQVQTEESITPVPESSQHYEQMLWTFIKESTRDKYEKMTRCYFLLAGCAGCLYENTLAIPPKTITHLDYFAVCYFIDLAKLFCECFFKFTSNDLLEKRLVLTRAKHAKVEFDSKNMLLPLVRLHAYKNKDKSKFLEVQNEVKRILRIALKWKTLLVKSTLISTISNVLWNTQETRKEMTTSESKKEELKANLVYKSDILETPGYFSWTSFSQDYSMDRFNGNVIALFPSPIQNDNIYIQNVKNIFGVKS